MPSEFLTLDCALLPSERNPLPQRTTNLSPALASLTKSIETLLSTPAPSTTTQSQLKSIRNRSRPTSDLDANEDEELGVWNQSRTSFVNWVAGKQSSTIGALQIKDVSGKGSGPEEGEEIGSKGDAKVSLFFHLGTLGASR